MNLAHEPLYSNQLLFAALRRCQLWLHRCHLDVVVALTGEACPLGRQRGLCRESSKCISSMLLVPNKCFKLKRRQWTRVVMGAIVQAGTGWVQSRRRMYQGLHVSKRLLICVLCEKKEYIEYVQSHQDEVSQDRSSQIKNRERG